MYQCSKKLVTLNDAVVLTILTFEHIQCLHLMYAEVAWILGNPSSVANNTRYRLPSRLSFRFLWLWLHLKHRYLQTDATGRNTMYTNDFQMCFICLSLRFMLNHFSLKFAANFRSDFSRYVSNFYIVSLFLSECQKFVVQQKSYFSTRQIEGSPVSKALSFPPLFFWLLSIV